MTMSYEPRNYKGDIISTPYRLRSKSYGTGEVNMDGRPKIDWGNHTPSFADSCGFDTRRNYHNGRYFLVLTLPHGTRLIRYGKETGRYTAPEGTPYEELSLPYHKDTVEFNTYVVSGGVKIVCEVKFGRVAPAFGAVGGGVQYRHADTVRNLLKSGVLKRV